MQHSGLSECGGYGAGHTFGASLDSYTCHDPESSILKIAIAPGDISSYVVAFVDP